MAVSDPVSLSITHTAPSPTAIPVEPGTGVVSWTISFVAGSIWDSTLSSTTQTAPSPAAM